MPQDSRKRFDPEWVLGPLRRRRWLAAVAFLVPFTGAVTLALALRDVYQSSATLLIERQQVSETFVKATVLGVLETRLQTINQEILSRSNLETLISRFHLYPGLLMPFAVDRMRRDIQVDMRSARSGGGGTATVAFAVTYRGINKLVVAQVASALAAFYIEENLKVRQRQATAAATFLKAPLQTAKEQLDEYDSRLREFILRNAGQMPQDLAANIATVGRLEQQLRLIQSDRLRALDRRESARTALTEAEAAALREANARALPGLADRVAQKRGELAELRTRYSDRYPNVIALKRDIAELERELASAPARDAERRATAPADPHVILLRQALAEVEQYIASLRAEEEGLRTEIADSRARLQNLGQRDEELKYLTRNFETARELYRSLLTRYDEAQLSASIEQRQTGEHFRLLDPAVPAELPSAPPRLLLLLVGLVGSIGVAAAALVVAESLDASFHTADDLQAATGARVIATIPWIASGPDALRLRWRRHVAAALLGILVMGVAAASFVAARRSDLLLVLPARPRS